MTSELVSISTIMTSKETSLRAHLQQNPLSAIAASTLACYLADQANHDESKRAEAMELANQAILLAPNKPAGYSALSIVSDNHSERIKSLQKVADIWNTNCSMTPSAFAGTLVRLLVEPREIESRQYKETTGQFVGKGSSSHPLKRALSHKESMLYNRIQQTLQLQNGDEVYLARIHLRLGTFFRKLLPIAMTQPICMSHLQRAVELFPTSHVLRKSAQFWLATQPKSDTYIDRCPEDYVKSLYSTFAANFDNLLVTKLNYETPTKLRKLVETVVTSKKLRWAQHACDLGCGTGLSGLAFRDCVEHMIGVDISPHMIAKAQERGCYEHLTTGDISTVLTPQAGFDFVFSCDVFCYIGDLGEVFRNIKHSMREEGIFAFSTEHLRSTDESRPFVLHECARFAHQESYIRQLAVEHQFQVVTVQLTPIRQNGGKDVMGMLVVFKHDNYSL